MDNVESMCFGRDLNGFRTLVLASDNNFSSEQITQFHVFTTNIPAVTRRTLSASSTGSGSGSVTASPSVAWYPDDSEVSLTAAPATGQAFVNWSGDATGTSNPIGLTMNADKSLVANFKILYATWGITYAGGQAANLDYDNDGVSNGIEYFMNAAPGYTANPALGGNTVTWPNGGNIPSSAYGTQFMVQTSSDLVSWTDVPANDSGLNNTASSLSYVVSGASRQFVRLKVTVD
jgi:hypothetical protein